MIVVTVARRPAGASTIAGNVKVHESGALNIDATRVGLGTGGAAPEYIPNKKNAVYGLGMGGGEWDQSKGRWPANLVLEHRSGCRRVGEKQVQGHRGYPNGPGGRSMHYTSEDRSSEKRPNAWRGHSDGDGLETVASWECMGRCPVSELEEQGEKMGMHSSGSATLSVEVGKTDTSMFGIGSLGPSHRFGDDGGASRFFKQVGGRTRE